eukprot:jgi/Botrbrau1/16678/Bobra.0068s0094.1
MMMMMMMMMTSVQPLAANVPRGTLRSCLQRLDVSRCGRLAKPGAYARSPRNGRSAETMMMRAPTSGTATMRLVRHWRPHSSRDPE